MTEKEYAKIVSKNLRRIAYENQKSQADISRDLKINKATVSSWMNGTRIPRMEKIDLLCNYFNVRRSDIMEEHPNKHDKSIQALSPEELSTITMFRLLNSDGKRKVIEYLSDLMESPKYTKDTSLKNA